MSNNPLKKPNYEAQFKADFLDEMKALHAFLRFHWWLVLLFAVGVAVLLYQIRPFPPRTITIATGQVDSTYEDLGQWYQNFFEKHGVKLLLVKSQGAVENVGLISTGKVDAAFSQGGVPLPHAPESPKIVSLGSIQYEPLWLFYRGPVFSGGNAYQFFKNKKISIGAERSGTRFMVEDLIRHHDVDPKTHQNLVTMDAETSVKALLNGSIDAMFLAANTESKNFEELISNPDIHVWNFEAARAIASKINYATAVILPAGSFSLAPLNPSQDIHLVATTSNILVPQSMHPAIQYLFMMASSEYYRTTHVYFNRQGGFPAFIEHAIPRSDVASKYLTVGPTNFEQVFPFWIASFVDRMWLIIVGILAVAYPLLRLVPHYRKFHFKHDLKDRYLTLLLIERDVHTATKPEEIDAILLRLDALDNQAGDMWVPAWGKDLYFDFCNALEVLRIKANRYRAKLAL